MLTTVKTMTKRKRETAHKNVRKNYRKYKKKNLEKKAITLLKKENVNTTSTRKIHTKF